MKKKISVLIITTLLCISTIVTINNDVNVEAIAGGDDEVGEIIGLDLDFMWNVTKNLSYVVHNPEVYPSGENVIRKGRAFGTEGDRWTADYLNYTMNDVLKLENAQKIQLGPIFTNPARFYTSRVNVSDYLLNIDREDFFYSNNS